MLLLLFASKLVAVLAWHCLNSPDPAPRHILPTPHRRYYKRG